MSQRIYLILFILFGSVIFLGYRYVEHNRSEPVVESTRRVACSLDITNVSDEDFEQVVENCSVPLMVSFVAPWSDSSESMKDRINKVAVEYLERVKFCIANIDESPILTAKYNINDVPQILCIHNGEVIESGTGLKSLDQLRRYLDKMVRLAN